MVKLIIIRGYPGSGKTTLGKVLHENDYGQLVDHNKILTFIASIVGDDEGIYEDIANLEKAIARKLLGLGKNVIVARGFSSKGSVVDYQRIAQEMHAQPVILRLEVNEQILSERVQAPERKKDFNPTINPSVLSTWIKNNPIEDIATEHLVEAGHPVDKVYEQACNIINSST